MTETSTSPPDTEDAVTTVPRPPRSDALVAAGLPTLLVALHASVYGSWIVDDAGITFAYARSIATGAGPVLQPGAVPAEGFSNPAWLALLVLGRWTGLFDRGAWFGVPDLVLFPKLLALLCCFGVFLCVYRLARRVSRSPVTVTVVAGAITAAVPSFVIWTTSGLENALLALAVVALATTLAVAVVERRLLTRQVAATAGLLAALALLTRPDGLVYVFAFPLAALLVTGWRDRRRAAAPVAVAVGAFAVPALAYLLWRTAVFGDWLPTTARAKEQGLPSPSSVSRPGELLLYAGWLTAVLVVAAVALTLARRSAVRPVLVALLAPLFLAVVAFAVLAPDWMGQYRFATPVWPLSAMVAVLAWGAVLARLQGRARVPVIALVVVGALISAAGWFVAGATFAARPTLSICGVAQANGYAYNAYADALGVRDGSFLGVDAGGTALTSRLRFVDLAGLTDARIARYWQDDDMAGLRDHVLDDVRPTMMRLFRGWNIPEESGLLADPRLMRDYATVSGSTTGELVLVRREAVPDPTALQAAVDVSARIASGLTRLYRGTTGETTWTCGPVLRPSAPGTFPLAGR